MEGLLPPTATERARPGSRSYAGLQQRIAFVRWLAAVIAASPLKRKQIARALWPDSAEDATTHQIKLYTEVRQTNDGPEVTLPSPPTLRKLCDLLGIPWTEAFANAGYYRELLQALADLADLGYQWIIEDGGGEVPKSFHYHGIAELRGVLMAELIERPEYAARYVVGGWEEGPFEPVEPDFAAHTDERERQLMREWLRQDAGQVRTVGVIVPKPLAVAILIATVGFARRGDLYKDTASAYAAELLRNATWLIDLAQERSHLDGLPPLLKRANDALKDRLLRLELKRVIAAEYTVAWADAQCNLYTHAARLGAMRRLGVAGSSESGPHIEERLPDIRRADLPSPSEFTQPEKVNL